MNGMWNGARRGVAVTTVLGLLAWPGVVTPIVAAEPVSVPPWIIDEGDRIAVRLGGPEGIDGHDVRIVFSKDWVPASGRLPEVTYRVTKKNGRAREFVLSALFADSVAAFVDASRFDPDAKVEDFLGVEDVRSLRALEKELSLQSLVEGVARDRSGLDSRALRARAETLALVGREGVGDLQMAVGDSARASVSNACLVAITAAAAGGIGVIACCAGTLGLACAACAFLEGAIIGLTIGICNSGQPSTIPTPGCGITCYHCQPSPQCECFAPIPMFPDPFGEGCYSCPDLPGVCI